MARLPSNVRVKVEGEPAFTTRLQDFLHANRDGLEASERRQLLAALLSGREFCSGGGAATAFCVTRPGKRSSLGGFGSPKAVHQKRRGEAIQHTRRLMQSVNTALHADDCGAAIRSLAAAAFNNGRSRAERLGAGKRTVIGSPILQLARRVAHKCAR